MCYSNDWSYALSQLFRGIRRIEGQTRGFQINGLKGVLERLGIVDGEHYVYENGTSVWPRRKCKPVL